MDIVKNLKDYKLSHEQRIFASFIQESMNAATCNEKVYNKKFIRKYFSPDNDFCVYSTAVDDLARLRQIKNPHYDDERDVG